MRDSQVAHELQLLTGPDGTVGVGRRGDDDRLGPPGDPGSDILVAGDETVFLVGGNEDRNTAGHADHLRIGDPAGRRDQDFVTWVQDRLEDRKEGMLGAVGDEDLLRGIGQAVIPLHFPGDGHPELHGAGNGRVARHAEVQGFLRGVADMLRRGKIRFAGAETDHVQAGSRHFLGAGIDLQRQGRSNVQTTVGNRQRHGVTLHSIMRMPVL